MSDYKYTGWLSSLTNLLLFPFFGREQRRNLVEDLQDGYTEYRKDAGAFRSFCWYVAQVWKIATGRCFNIGIWTIPMMGNYGKIALRNFRRNKMNTIINVLSLALAFSCCVLIFSFIYSEFTWDRFHTNADRIFEIYSDYHYRGDNIMQATPQGPLAPTLPDRFPEIEAAARIGEDELVVKYQDKSFTETVIGTEASFFRIFTFPVISGGTDAEKLDLNSAVLNPAIAVKYFGTENPVGKTIAINIAGTFKDFTVSGVLKAVPENSSIRPDIIINIRNIYGSRLDKWNAGTGPGVFVLLDKSADAQLLQKRFPATIDGTLDGMGILEKSEHILSPFSKFHFAGTFTDILKSRSSKTYSYMLIGICLLILIVAVSNFISLTMGNAAPRLKEFALRKTFGAGNKQLIRQFCVESSLISFISMAIGILFAYWFLPTFKEIAQRPLTLDYLTHWKTVLFFIAAGLATGILAGGYPAIALTRFATADMLKKVLKISSKNTFSRIIIIFQFAITIFFLISTLIISSQYHYMLNRKFGMASENVLILDLRNDSNSSGRNGNIVERLSQNLQKYRQVRDISCSESKFNMFSARVFNVNQKQRTVVIFNTVNYEYIRFFNIKLLEGRTFDKKNVSDAGRTIIVNEAFVHQYNIESPVGKKLSDVFFNPRWDAEIIGVTADFHYSSLHNKIEPAFLTVPKDLTSSSFDYLYIKISNTHMQETIGKIKNELAKTAPDIPFRYSFMDDEIAQEYESERQYARMFRFLSLFAILISCSGLFGLTTLTISRRAKEISIRKVLGASFPAVLQLVNIEFLTLVIIGNIIAWPAGYYAAVRWLQNFAYTTRISPLFFIIAGAASVSIAFLTISAKAVASAAQNPVNNLRNE